MVILQSVTDVHVFDSITNQQNGNFPSKHVYFDFNVINTMYWIRIWFYSFQYYFVQSEITSLYILSNTHIKILSVVSYNDSTRANIACYAYVLTTGDDQTCQSDHSNAGVPPERKKRTQATVKFAIKYYDFTAELNNNGLSKVILTGSRNSILGILQA